MESESKVAPISLESELSKISGEPKLMVLLDAFTVPTMAVPKALLPLSAYAITTLLALESKVAAKKMELALSKTCGEPTAVESLEVAISLKVPLLLTITVAPSVIAPSAIACTVPSSAMSPTYFI